jgi:hypothetical protein
VKANQAGRSTSCLIVFWASNSSRAPSFAFTLGPSIIFLLIFARYSQLALFFPLPIYQQILHAQLTQGSNAKCIKENTTPMA